MRSLTIETPTHGRVLVEDEESPATSPGVIVTFHGYGQRAEDALAELARMPASRRWTRVAVQGLHRFYTRGDQQVVASWMTREDRDAAIVDNVEYVNRSLDVVMGALTSRPRASFTPTLALIGFSQGAAMAYRAAMRGAYRADLVVALGGDIPPDVKAPSAGLTGPTRLWPRVVVGVGSDDLFYDESRGASDEAFLTSAAVDHRIVRYDGGHRWTDAFAEAVDQELVRLEVMKLAATSMTPSSVDGAFEERDRSSE